MTLRLPSRKFNGSVSLSVSEASSLKPVTSDDDANLTIIFHIFLYGENLVILECPRTRKRPLPRSTPSATYLRQNWRQLNTGSVLEWAASTSPG